MSLNMLTILIRGTALTHFARWMCSICLFLQWHIKSISLNCKSVLELAMVYYFC